MSSIRILAGLVLALPAALCAAPLLPAASACGSQAQVSPDLRVKNTAHWTTASEENNFGYDVYRATSEKGPFVKLTKTPILGNGTTLETHKYEFADDGIDPCKDYWYYVESIATDGSREKFTPVFHVPAKRHPSVQKKP
ncbi:MAG TPA: hypothetical protein VL425_02960 [Rudaea sp.]|nr:hypothetical protein [Rudaea sp.]